MKYLILGSSGQIGTDLTTYLLDQSQEVVEFDLVRSHKEDLRIKDNIILREQLAISDFVYFLAFDVGGAEYLKRHENTYEFLSNNSLLMVNTFELLRETGKPFIFTSSQMADMSFSSYGLLKALGENYTRCLNGLIVKMWNVYGNESDEEKAHVITDFVIKASNTRCIDMVTDGKEERQFLYVRDCSECLFLLSQRYDSLNRDRNYHISSFEWTSILEVAELVAEFFPGTIIKPGTDMDYIQRNSRIEPDANILNYWKPNTSLKDGILNIAKHYQKHRLTN